MLVCCCCRNPVVIRRDPVGPHTGTTLKRATIRGGGPMPVGGTGRGRRGAAALLPADPPTPAPARAKAEPPLGSEPAPCVLDTVGRGRNFGGIIRSSKLPLGSEPAHRRSLPCGRRTPKAPPKGTVGDAQSVKASYAAAGGPRRCSLIAAGGARQPSSH